MDPSQIGRYLDAVVDKMIRIDRGGPESRVGKLIGVYNDYIALLTKEEGVIYYRTQHIKSITENVKDIKADELGEEEVEPIIAASFTQLLDHLKLQWVQINRGGPEKLEGVLNDMTDDIVTVVANKEVIRLSSFHIRNISVVQVKNERSDSEQESNNEKSRNKKRRR